MNESIKIPAGWYRLPPSSILKRGDKWYEFSFKRFRFTGMIGNPLPNESTYIRRKLVTQKKSTASILDYNNKRIDLKIPTGWRVVSKGRVQDGDKLFCNLTNKWFKPNRNVSAKDCVCVIRKIKVKKTLIKKNYKNVLVTSFGTKFLIKIPNDWQIIKEGHIQAGDKYFIPDINQFGIPSSIISNNVCDYVCIIRELVKREPVKTNFGLNFILKTVEANPKMRLKFTGKKLSNHTKSLSVLLAPVEAKIKLAKALQVKALVKEIYLKGMEDAFEVVYPEFAEGFERVFKPL